MHVYVEIFLYIIIIGFLILFNNEQMIFTNNSYMLFVPHIIYVFDFDDFIICMYVVNLL